MMSKVRVLGVLKPYDILIGKGILKTLPQKLSEITDAKKAVIITDDNVNKFYGDYVLKLLSDNGYETYKFVFKNGEQNKTLGTVSDILEFMAEKSVTRSDVIVALGGGIVGDVSGFCAASYLRGIDFVQVPTTFLASIDSSVGGKTGVNLKSGKNLAGAFYQPRLVLCDTEVFNTLPEENFKEGIAEAIKYGVICDNELFNKMSGNIKEELIDIITTCVSIKSDIVSKDEFDKGERQLLNFGHTIGHAIEKCSNFSITHGIAVGIGMAMIAKASDELGYSKEKCYTKIKDTLIANGLLYKCDFSDDELYSVMTRDKKRAGDYINLVVPEQIGKCVLKKISVSELKDVLNNA